MALVYRKALSLRVIDMGASGHGNVVNLMSNDAQKFFDIMMVLHLIWAAPLQIVLAASFLIWLLSWCVCASLRAKGRHASCDRRRTSLSSSARRYFSRRK